MLAILPEARRRRGADSPVCPDFGAHRYAKTHFDVIHQAVSGQQVLQLRYQDETGRVTERDVLPRAVFLGRTLAVGSGANCAMITAIFASIVARR